MDTLQAYQVFANDGNKQPFAEQRAPARWTSGKMPAIYTSGHAATALLEFLAHLESSLPDSLCCARLVLSAEQVETLETLPENWKERPYRAGVQQVGDAWLSSARSLALRVPSAISPAEFNLILNPRHPDYAGCGVEFTEMFRLDSRLS